jgi:hypothetical protein
MDDPGKKNVRINDKDVERAERIGYAGKSASTAITDLLKEVERLRKLQEEKEEELQRRREDIRDEARRYGIED